MVAGCRTAVRKRAAYVEKTRLKKTEEKPPVSPRKKGGKKKRFKNPLLIMAERRTNKAIAHRLPPELAAQLKQQDGLASDSAYAALLSVSQHLADGNECQQ